MQDEVWRVTLSALCSSQQKSGKGTKVAAFLARNPFPLTFAECDGHRDNIADFVSKEISSSGLRFGGRIGKFCKKNIDRVNVEWFNLLKPTLDQLKTHPSKPSDHILLERKICYSLSAFLSGIGPKQSRNMLLNFGLSRYEIPIDSRMTKWMRLHLAETFGFLKISKEMLADEDCYAFILSGIQALCADAGVFPSAFDAAVFAAIETR